MFRNILAGGLTLAALTQAGTTTEQDIALDDQCKSIRTPSFTGFDVRTLEKDGWYEVAIGDGANFEGELFRFNYCDYLYGDDEDLTSTIATDQTYAQFGADGRWSAAATMDIDEATNLRDEDGKTTGVTFTQGSISRCKKDEKNKQLYYSMKTNLYCDETKSVPTDFDVTYADCLYTVTTQSAAGCPSVNIDTDEVKGWLSENEWVFGIVYLIAGPLIALFGTRQFPYVTAAIVAIFVIGLIISFGMAMEWMNSGAGCAIIMCLALLLGVISGMLVRRKIWLMVSLLGVVAGFFSGAFIYAMIYSINGWDAVWGYYLISITFAIIGFLLSLKLGKSIVITGTSMIGSYLFMRAWTLFFPGHYPSESEIVEDYENVELDDIFWVFFGMFIACFIGSMVFQCTTQKPNDELEEAYKKVD